MKQAKENALAEAGRRTNSLFKPEYMEKVDELCRLGATDRDIALYFDVSYGTIVDWKKQHPAFFLALLRGKQKADGTVSESLFKSANGYDYYEEVSVKLRNVTGYEDGKPIVEERVEIVRVLKHKPAEVTAQIFWLKNRRPDVWRDVKKIELDQLDQMKETKTGEAVAEALKQKGLVEIEGEFEIITENER